MAGRLPDTVRWRIGKEHLGWTTTQALARHWAMCGDIVASERQQLAEYISLAHFKATLQFHSAEVSNADAVAGP